MMTWYEEFGFDENPFKIDPLKGNFKLINRDKEAEEVLYRITSGNMLLIEGKPSSGKTALLRHAIDNFKGKGKVVYIDGNKLNKRLNVANLLKKKGMILLMDNVGYLSKKNNDRIKYFYDQDHIKSVVFTTNDYNAVNFSEALKDRIGKNIIKLDDIGNDYALEIAKSGLGENDLLSDDILNELHNDSSNVKEFLIKCHLLCSYVVDQGKVRAEKEDIKKMPELDKGIEENESGLCDDCGNQLVKINDAWRCEKCDKFCKSCGALIDEEDDNCPECDKEVEK